MNLDNGNKTPRILISGAQEVQNFERCWFDWLQDRHYPVRAFDPNSILLNQFQSELIVRILWKFFRNVLVSVVSRRFVMTVCSFKPDLILVVSGNLISANALQTVRNKTKAALYHFYGEDFFNPLNTTRTLRDASFLYDHLFTTKSFNVSEMARIGLTRVSYIPHGYRPNCDYPVTIGQVDRHEYGSDLAFVGTWEADRASTLSQLKEFDLRIWGADWHKAGNELRLRNVIQNRVVYCDEMSRVFNASKINLAFLRKANRDRHTSRTFEIPACGGFQLSERTDEVLGFFEEGREIECFESVDELKDKAHYYLTHETQRQRIASAGKTRVQRCAYSYTDRLQSILEHYSGTKPL
jgi:spore maturation protein CgeB